MAGDLVALATTVVSSFLVPYVKLGIDKIAEKITEKAGETAADKAVSTTQKVWDKVKAMFSGEDEAALQNFEKYDGAGEDLIIKILAKYLEENPSFAEELDDLVNPPKRNDKGDGSTGATVMKAHIAGIVDARNADFSNARDVNITGASVNDQKDKPTDGI